MALEFVHHSDPYNPVASVKNFLAQIPEGQPTTALHLIQDTCGMGAFAFMVNTWGTQSHRSCGQPRYTPVLSSV